MIRKTKGNDESQIEVHRHHQPHHMQRIAIIWLHLHVLVVRVLSQLKTNTLPMLLKCWQQFGQSGPSQEGETVTGFALETAAKVSNKLN